MASQSKSTDANARGHPSSGPPPFSVGSALLRLSVLTDGEAVVEIRLNETAKRRATGALEHQVERELREYVAGERRRFEFPYHARGTPFELAVWQQLERIPYGDTRTYGEVARAMGRPLAARAVGGANHRNPLPLVIPCHRVVAAGGKLGGYGGGPALKRQLLALEGALP